MPFPYRFPIIWKQVDNDVEPEIAVDWQATGGFTDAGDDVTARVLTRSEVSAVRGRDQIRALAPPMAGAAAFELDNISRDYSAENPDSPLYGKVDPGRQVRLRALWRHNYYNLFKGLMDEPQQNPSRAQRSVTVPCLGSLSWLRGKKISTPLYENITTGEALEHLLDGVGWPTTSSSGPSEWGTGLWDTAIWGAAGWPAVDRVIDTGQTTLLYWWCNDDDAFDMAVKLLNTEGPGATLYEDGQGRIVFEDRSYRLVAARCTTSQATFRDTGEEPCFYREGYQYSSRQKDIINLCTATVNVRELAALGAVWDYGSSITLAAGATGTYQVSTSTPFKNAVTPVSGTDFTVTAGAVSVVSLDRTSGASCTISITAGGAGCTITGLQLRAQSLPVASAVKLTNSYDTTDSQYRYGQQPYSQNIWPEISPAVAQDFCDAIVIAYQEPRAAVELVVRTRDDYDRVNQILNREISDRVAVVEAQTGVVAEFYIERIGYTITGNGKILQMALGLEKAGDGGSSLWDTGLWDTMLWGY